MNTVLAELRQRPEWPGWRVAALAMDSYTHGAVLLDEHLQVIRPTIIWTDQRSAPECQALDPKPRDHFRIGYQMPTPTWTLPQMMWLRKHEPDAWRRIRHISFVKDYIRFRLCGSLATDRIECQGTLFYDMGRQCWSEELCALAGIDLAWLPPIADITDLAGHVTPEAAAATGLPVGTPVIMGASDSAVEDYADGAIHPGNASQAATPQRQHDATRPHRPDHLSHCPGSGTVSATTAPYPTLVRDLSTRKKPSRDRVSPMNSSTAKRKAPRPGLMASSSILT